VGNIAGRNWRLNGRSVHPHGRGEHQQQILHWACQTGSSPRAWGTCDPGDIGKIKHRFIPTGVGNIGYSIPAILNEAVHPHGRGEHCIAVYNHILDGGSSPRAWGT